VTVRVYQNETVDSVLGASTSTSVVEFDVHQREVYGEWGFQWAHAHVLASFNLTGVACDHPCPVELCESGAVSAPPRLHELADLYDGDVFFVVMASGAPFYLVAWIALAVLVGSVVYERVKKR